MPSKLTKPPAPLPSRPTPTARHRPSTTTPSEPSQRTLRLPPEVRADLDVIQQVDPRVPSLASRRVWAAARNVNPAAVHTYFNHAKRTAVRRGLAVGTGTYELAVDAPRRTVKIEVQDETSELCSAGSFTKPALEELKRSSEVKLEPKELTIRMSPPPVSTRIAVPKDVPLTIPASKKARTNANAISGLATTPGSAETARGFLTHPSLPKTTPRKGRPTKKQAKDSSRPQPGLDRPTPLPSTIPSFNTVTQTTDHFFSQHVAAPNPLAAHETSQFYFSSAEPFSHNITHPETVLYQAPTNASLPFLTMPWLDSTVQTLPSAIQNTSNVPNLSRNDFALAPYLSHNGANWTSTNNSNVCAPMHNTFSPSAFTPPQHFSNEMTGGHLPEGKSSRRLPSFSLSSSCQRSLQAC